MDVLNPLIIKWGAIALLILSVFGSGWHLGAKNVQSKWDFQSAVVAAESAKTLQEAQERVLTVERESVAKLVSVQAQYQKQLKGKQSEEASAISLAYSGGLRIDAECPSNPSALSNTAASTTGGNGTTRVRLSKEAGEFLVRLAAEADRVTEQLTACQATIEADRK
jgi:hypothetical protein